MSINLSSLTRRPSLVIVLPLTRATDRSIQRVRPAFPHPSPLRAFHSTRLRSDIPSWPNPPVPQPAVTPADQQQSNSNDNDGGHSGGHGRGGAGGGPSTWQTLASSPFVQAGLTTFAGLILVFGGGIGYLTWFKYHVLKKMEGAFAPGYDPALELGSLHLSKGITYVDPDSNSDPSSAPFTDSTTTTRDHPSHIRRSEQSLIDSILRGEQAGSYFMLLGSKGVGKGTMVVDAMRAVKAEGASFVEAHGDLEVFRQRLGKAIHYEFNEDWQGSLFSRRDPHEGGPLLDVERALNKLDKVAVRYTKRQGRPLVLAFNNLHLLPDDESGRALLHQLQHRAEAWAEAGICTMIFSSDDYWPLDVMKKNASRMRVVSVYDLKPYEALRALRYMRATNSPHLADTPPDVPRVVEGDSVMKEVLSLVGGRTSHLMRVARAEDMVEEARAMIEMEKQWMLSKIGLIVDCDDDVMDEQKWASCSWLLLQEFYKRHQKATEEGGGVELTEVPKMTYGDARQTMTRADFLSGLDLINIVSIDVNHHVRPDSMIIHQALKQVVEEEDFEERLQAVQDRINQIEALHRQSELTVKEPFRIKVRRSWWKGGDQAIEVEGLGSSFVPAESTADV